VKFNYFDFGLFRGVEMGWMNEYLLPSLGIKNYHIYGFEACGRYAENLRKKYTNDDKVTILNKAIAEKAGKVKLYYAENAVGHSIFSTKNNVSKNYEEVEGIVFSEWLKKNIPDFESSFNVIKVNIEGAEWFLFNDIIKNNLNKHIKIYCGQGHDVEKIGELENKVADYYKLLEENKIHLYRWTEWKPQKNDNIRDIIIKEAKKIIEENKSRGEI
jgi:FkbM family methyltransferase